ncbi:MAG TPA: class II glutamine amidotransferase, partial [Acidiferrobacteraceae bacterium]|nr:class II glutamine amidotransferase [Acidiferrobacteraceae bacterium]
MHLSFDRHLRAGRQFRYDEIMCRMAAYIGPELLLEQFLFAPSHNLVEQSWRPREMTVGHLNADGYGFAWYRRQEPNRFVSPFPIWGDSNLPALGRSLQSCVWLGAVRGATPGFAAHPANTQPFVAESLSFLHNGHIPDFATGARARIRALLTPAIEAGIEGTTDSEYLFALLRQSPASLSLENRVRALNDTLRPALGTDAALLNLLVSDGKHVVALRHACATATPPSLYYTEDDPQFPGGTVISSEPLTNAPAWHP